MKFLLKLLISLSLLFFGFNSCQKEPTGSDPDNLPPLGTIIFHDNVRILTGDQNQELKALDTQGLEFVFNSQFAANQVKAGEILIGAPTSTAPYGFLRRVLSKSVKSDGTIRLETEFCSLTEAIKTCNVVETFAPSDWERSPEIDISYQTKFDNDQSVLKLGAKYTPSFYLKLTKVAGSNDFKGFRIGCDLNRQEELDFSTNVTLLGTGDKYKYTEQWKGLPVLLAGALWVFPYYEHESGFKGDIKTGLKLGFKHESVQTFYKDFENGGFTPIQRINTVVTPYTGYFDIDASAVGELYTEEKVGLRLYEVIGAEIGIKGVLNGTVTKEPNQPLKKCLDLSIETGMSVYASVFGQKLASLDGKVVWYEKDIIPCLDGPKVTTANPTNIGTTAASGGGSITDGSGSQITARGVCWTTGDSATIAGPHTTDGSGIGTFSSQITGLSPGTTYKVRAYAQTTQNNTISTYYGNQVVFTTTGNSPSSCGAYVAPGVWKEFMCHNLGAANTSADPFTPSWEINGGYWQWGRKTQAAAGPSGVGLGQANDGAISGWNTAQSPNGSWQDGNKTSNDPCPNGFQLPTKEQWDGITANNSTSIIGVWNENATNYSAGRLFGSSLMLPASGGRTNFMGSLVYRGYAGQYWSSTEYSSIGAWSLGFTNSGASTGYYDGRTYGLSVRCIAAGIQISGTISQLKCNEAAVIGTLVAGQSSSGVTIKVPYSGGNGGSHGGQSVSSTGITGLTAVLAGGNFVNGSSTVDYTIDGTPSQAGTAYFALTIGGQSCTVQVSVGNSTGSCGAYIAPGVWKEFMCHNLGAANTSADPFTPSWEINGGYWQWGRKDQAAAGPTGPGTSQANSGSILGWNSSYAPNGAWSDNTKTVNDPCPSGYRIPTETQWAGVEASNTITNLGTWSTSATNYSSGKKFGNNLFLPAAGYRFFTIGNLYSRGKNGNYWGSTEKSTDIAWNLNFDDSYTDTSSSDRRFGFSVRCIAD